MKIPLSWIKRFIPTEKSAEEIADLLTLAGIEVDKIDRLNFSFEGVIIGHIKEVHPHENADRLKVARVYDGKKEHIVVCGAPNLPAGKKVAFAPIGAILDKDSPSPFILKKAKIREVESKGMLCTAKELAIGPNGDDLLFLDDSAPVGMDLIQYYKDPIFDITLTPNLGHCRSVLGIARELSRYHKTPLCLPEIKIEQSTGKKVSDLLSIKNEIKDLCPQFSVRVVSGIELKPSPLWMRDLLEKSGITPINNVVDITNYVMHELGQPLHAYDYSKLKHKNMSVRLAHNNEILITLDGKERILKEDDIIVTADDTPIALAGIMGGQATAVSSTTHTIILEAAEFCSSSIRKTTKDLKLRTEASSRFENGIDGALLLFALDYAAFLLQEIAGASISRGIIHEAILYRPLFQTVRLSRVNKILGTKLSLNEVEGFLLSLGFTATSDGVDLFQLKTPSWRHDISREIDIIEEIARVYGYNNISVEAPKHITSNISHHPLYILEKLLRVKLTSLGLNEFLTCSLISKELSDLNISHDLFEVNPIEVMHAKSLDQSILRPSFLPGMLNSLSHNKNNGNSVIAAFELGKIFSNSKDQGFLENAALGILLSGETHPYHFDRKVKIFDFFDMKGILEDLFKTLLIEGISITKSEHKTFHPGIQANIVVNGDIIATFGKVHPEITSKMKLDEDIYFAEASTYLIEKYRIKHAVYKKISNLPSSFRDVTFTIAKEKRLNELFSLLEKSSFDSLKEYSLRSIYTDEKNSPDKKNITFRFIYRDDLSTLDDQAITSCHEKVVAYLSKAL